MLSDMNNTTHLNRPRPPGRRASANKVEKSIQDENNPLPLQSSSSSSSSSSSPRRASTSLTTHQKVRMENDLDLELPQDFAVAFQSRLWTQSRKQATLPDGELNTRCSPLGGSLGRKHLREVRDTSIDKLLHFNHNNAPSNSHLDSLFHLDTEALHGISPVDASDDEDHEPASIESEVESEHSVNSFNSDWVGGLPREELETLLMQANRIIRDRERDLGVAAKIGKALLEKNISLRSKHEGIMSRLSSVNSFGDIHLQTMSYSPSMESDLAELDESEKGTPTPTGMVDEYFKGTSDVDSEVEADAIQSPFKLRSIRAPLPTNWSAPETIATTTWSLPKDYFVPSVPASPAGSRLYGHQENSIGQFQFSHETQKQLEVLSEQNEALLEQLSDLQREAEEAKKSGGKRLKKLNREIEGLRTELEAATERNDELERVAADDDCKSKGDSGNIVKVRRAWKRRGQAVQSNVDDSVDEANTSQQSSSTVRGSDDAVPGSKREARRRARTTSEGISEAGSIIPRSDSSFSSIMQSKGISEPERALVAQLMSKIRELEETNATLALAGTEMDGRIGKAMEEGERIRDAYEAVENVAALEETQMKREDSDILETQFTDASIVSPNLHRNRRAPGNRYLIEGRRTVRAALRSEKEPQEYFYDSENDSNLALSPVKGRAQKVTLRPRILITPSAEDLRSRAREDSLLDWDYDSRNAGIDSQADGDIMSSTPIKQAFKKSSYDGCLDGDSPGMKSFDSVGSITYNGRKTLGSELGNVFGGQDDLNTTTIPNMRHRFSIEAISQYADTQRRGSIGSNKLRNRASVNSLRAPSEAESDIADLKWSVSGDMTIQADDFPTADCGQGVDDSIKELTVITTSGHLVTSTSPSGMVADGVWYSTNDDFVSKGCLQNELESTHDSYEWIEKVTKKMPLHWADDDDFGRPITERDARQLGLLEGPSHRVQQQQKSRGLLAWVQGKHMRQADVKGKMSEASQIESREQVEERERLSDLLREKRVVALQKRVLSGQISTRRAREIGVDLSQGQSKIIKEFGEVSLEEEVTQRAIAYSTARSRRIHAGRPGKEMRRKKSSNNDGIENRQSSDDEEFELLDLDPSKRRPGRKGTDYYPITLRERYKPTMVKQRAKHFSGEAITWASAWATFSLVMVFAFLVTFSRGPKRVLNGQSNKRTT